MMLRTKIIVGFGGGGTVFGIFFVKKVNGASMLQ